MLNEVRALLSPRLIGWIAIVAALAAIFLVSPSYAQEAPDASPQAPDEQDTQESGTLVFLEVEAPGGEPVKKGDTFFVHVMVSDVENLSAFSYEIGYDPDRVRPVSQEGQDPDVATPTPFGGTPVPGSDDALQNILVEGEIGQMVAESPRNSLCAGPFVKSLSSGVVTAGCVGVSLPVCLGGPPGVSGSGTLGTIVFKSRGGDMTQLALASPVLTSDDVEPPCDPIELRPVTIASSSGSPVTVLLSGGGGSSVLLFVIIAIVVVAALGAGLGGYLLYRRREAPPAASD